MKRKLQLLLCLLFVAGCDKGLSPPPERPSISGTVRFLSPWPHQDSIRIMALALVQPPPPYTGTQILSGFGKTVLPVIGEFIYGTTDTSFYIELDTGTYSYLGVAQQFGPDFANDWRVLGFVHDELDSALTFHIDENTQVTGINIDVRFDSLPRQPFVR
ncbi:MAG TPA: hypothetical protein VFH43_09685 [Candidatus Kapabacteria bacterium]|jgi:hypothetical protein|nr:hypothetical protein [Candidatus Kapabacteria bacterium]